jgi:hypothetical protein|tara:strand:+ start:845 stop:1096 length:252 start_codon:yes stop_codon:yes gene_type:complete
MTKLQNDDPKVQNPKARDVQQEAKPVAKVLTLEAQRALAEAKERRIQADADKANKPQNEYGGRGGADPSRFGDWEIDGRAIDF